MTLFAGGGGGGGFFAREGGGGGGAFFPLDVVEFEAMPFVYRGEPVCPFPFAYPLVDVAGDIERPLPEKYRSGEVLVGDVSLSVES